MVPIRLIAGSRAYDIIREKGLSSDTIYAIASAAGGPKWFTIYGLSRYVLSELVHKSNQRIHLLGSSVGSWQMAAGATKDPGAAIDRLKKSYCEYIYSDKPGPQEISEACRIIVESMVGDNSSYILSNLHRPLHVFATRIKGSSLFRNMALQTVMLGSAAAGNAISRKYLRYFVQRFVFSSDEELPYKLSDDLPTTRVFLNTENLISSMHASGAIPYVMDGIHDIAMARKGVYWDGGITDYHMSLPYDTDDGVVIIPHFSPNVLEGWFDKKLPWNRIARPEYMKNVLIICPTKEYVESLPKKRISQLQDFYDFGIDQQARINYWNQICNRSFELADSLNDVISTGDLTEYLEHYPGSLD